MKIIKSSFVNKLVVDDYLSMLSIVEFKDCGLDYIVHADCLLKSDLDWSQDQAALLISEYMEVERITGVYITNYVISNCSDRMKLYISILYAKIFHRQHKILYERNSLLNLLYGFLFLPVCFIRYGYINLRREIPLMSHHLRMASKVIENINKFKAVYSTHPYVTESIKRFNITNLEITTLYTPINFDVKLNGTDLFTIFHFGQKTQYRESSVNKLLDKLNVDEKKFLLSYKFTDNNTTNIASIVFMQSESMPYLSSTKAIAYLRMGKIPLFDHGFKYHPSIILGYTIDEYLKILQKFNYNTKSVIEYCQADLNSRVGEYNSLIRIQ